MRSTHSAFVTAATRCPSGQHVTDGAGHDCASARWPVCEDTGRVDRQAVHDELDQARTSFHQLLDRASDADLRRRSDGTRWNNKQLLFHMLLGYLIVRALRGLVVTFDRLPTAVDRRFAQVLNAVTVPFDAVNYAGAWLAGSALPRRALHALGDRVIASLHRRLDAETDTDLARSMRFPTRWDPFFRDQMTLADVYHFPTQHFDFHRDQLTLTGRGDRDTDG